jgi:hypothetical protein
MLATEMLPEFEKEAKARKEATRDKITGIFTPSPSKDGNGKKRHNEATVEAGKIFNVSSPTIQRAKRIQQEAPERVNDIVSGRATVFQVDEELRETKAEKHREEVQEKETKTLPAQHPKAVKDYLVSCAVYRDSLELAIKCARADMFDPSAISIITTKHNAIRALMAEMEELV